MRTIDGNYTSVKLIAMPYITDAGPSISPVDLTRFGLNSDSMVRESGPVHILIGVDYAEFHTVDVSSKWSLYLRQSLLGPVLFGNKIQSLSPSVCGVNVAVVGNMDLSRFWDTEQMGVALNDCCVKEKSNKKRLSPK